MNDILKKVSIILSRKQKYHLIMIIILMIISAFLEMGGISLIIPLISLYAQEEKMLQNLYIQNIMTFLNISSIKNLMYIGIIFLIIFFIVKNIFLYYEYFLQTNFIVKGKYKLQSQILHKYLSRKYEYFLGSNSGDIIRNINTDSNNVFSIIQSLITLMTEMITCIGIIIAIFIVNIRIAIIAAVIGFIIVFILYLGGRHTLKKAGRTMVYATSKAYKWLLQSIEGIKAVKIMHKEDYFESQYILNNQEWALVEKDNLLYGRIPALFIETFCILVALLALLAINLLNLDIVSLLPIITALAYAVVKIIPSINKICVSINSIIYYKESLNQIISTFNLQEKYQMDIQIPTHNKIKDVQKVIKMEGITYAYPDTNKVILEKAEMIIPQGSSVGVVGTSGAGKTTTIDILLGLLEPTEGVVTVDNVKIKDDYYGWLSHIGYIPQTIFMLDDTIRANVAFGCDLNSADDERVWKVLREAQLDDYVKSLPEKLDTEVGERGVRLSGGQRQRMGIARALYHNPDVLVFDEATSALDNETEKSIMRVVDCLHGEKTMIIIAHRLTTIENCDIIFRVDAGKIFCEKNIFEKG